MGRRSYAARLAFGRSPYAPLSQTDAGDTILGPDAHAHGNPDIPPQQFDERGHPQCRSSRAAARQLRRAKNDVLSTVGVVYKTGTTLSQAKKDELLEIGREENDLGFMLYIVSELFALCSLWWLISFRLRLQAFSRDSFSLTHLLKFEYSQFGPLSFFFAGLPSSFLAIFLSGGPSQWMMTWSSALFGPTLSTIVLKPLLATVYTFLDTLGALQSLQLVRTLRLSDVKPLLMKFWQLPRRHPSIVVNTLTSPVFLVFVYMYLQGYVHGTLEDVIESYATKPDRPDAISYYAAKDDPSNFGYVPGLRNVRWTLRNELGRQAFYFGRNITNFKDMVASYLNWLPQNDENAGSTSYDSRQSSPSGRVREPLSGISTVANTASEETSSIELNSNPSDEEQPRRSRRRFAISSPRSPSPATTPPTFPHLRPSLIPEGPDGITMQLEVIDQQHEILITPSTDGPVDSSATTITSTTTPSRPSALNSPTALENQIEEISNLTRALRALGDDISDPDPESQPHLDPGTLVEETDTPASGTSNSNPNSNSHSTTTSNPDSPSHRPPIQPDPEFIASTTLTPLTPLTTHPNPSTNPPPNPPLDRAGAAALARRAARANRPRKKRHRVTTLSNLPATSFAALTTRLLTALIMLPVEAIIVRAGVRAFLSADAVNSASLLGVVAGGSGGEGVLRVREVWAWQGWRFQGALAICLGLQATVSAVGWGVGMGGVGLVGRRWFRWGEI